MDVHHIICQLFVTTFVFFVVNFLCFLLSFWHSPDAAFEIDGYNRMWVVDSGRINSGVAAAGAAKLLIFNLSSSPGICSPLQTNQSALFFRQNIRACETTNGSLCSVRLANFGFRYANGSPLSDPQYRSSRATRFRPTLCSTRRRF
jgi:hypothetical protein